MGILELESNHSANNSNDKTVGIIVFILITNYEKKDNNNYYSFFKTIRELTVKRLRKKESKYLGVNNGTLKQFVPCIFSLEGRCVLVIYQCSYNVEL